MNQLAKWLFYHHQEIQMDLIWDEEQHTELDFNDLPEEEQEVYNQLAEQIRDCDVIELTGILADNELVEDLHENMWVADQSEKNTTLTIQNSF